MRRVHDKHGLSTAVYREGLRQYGQLLSDCKRHEQSVSILRDYASLCSETHGPLGDEHISAIRDLLGACGDGSNHEASLEASRVVVAIGAERFGVGSALHAEGLRLVAMRLCDLKRVEEFHAALQELVSTRCHASPESGATALRFAAETLREKRFRKESVDYHEKLTSHLLAFQDKL